MDYKPYTLEWFRKKYLAEAIQKYFEDGVSANMIADDIIDVLEKRASMYRKETNKLEDVLDKLK